MSFATNTALDMNNDPSNSTPAPLDQTDPVLEFVGKLSTEKRAHGALIFEGICTKCAHCGMPLTDAESVQRGIGPICSQKGYAEDPKDADEMQAMISLAEFPDVCTFLVENYRPQGVRGLVNGLVRLASLNRGKDDFHAACCDAISALGFARMANLLRESISVIQLKDSETHPGCVEVWVKKYAYTRSWSLDTRQIPGNFYDRQLKRLIIPLEDPQTKARKGGRFEGRKMWNKAILWELMVRHFAGMCGKKVGGSGFKIVRKPVDDQ